MTEAGLLILIAILFLWVIGLTILVIHAFDAVHSILNIQEQMHSTFLRELREK